MTDSKLTFEGDPEYPLKFTGIVEMFHWEISTRYAIDSKNNCWMDNGHGGPLKKVAFAELRNLVRNQFAKAKGQLDRVENIETEITKDEQCKN